MPSEPLFTNDDDNIIEGTAIVISETKPKRVEHWQATIKPKTDHKRSNIENIPVELGGPPTKNDAWTVLVHYLVPKVNRTEVRQIFEATMFGKKPHFKRAGHKFTFTFENFEGQFIEEYDLTFIEV